MADNGADCDNGDPYWSSRSRARVQEARQELVCPICFEMFSEPRTLACQHTFCTNCLQRLADASRPGRRRNVNPYPSPKASSSDIAPAAASSDDGGGAGTTISCPECRAKVYLPGNGVLGLAKNFKLERIIEILSPSEREQLSRRKRRPSHRCSTHSDRVTDYYCTMCRVLACGDCLLDQHANHTKAVKRTSEVVAEHVQALKGLIPAAREALGKGEDSLKTLKTGEESLRSQSMEAMKDIEAYFGKICDILEKRVSELKSEVTKQVEEGRTKFEQHSLALQNSVSEIRKCTRDLEKIAECEDSIEVLAREDQLRNQLETSQKNLERSRTEAAAKVDNLSIQTPPLEDRRLEVLCRTLGSKAPVPLPRKRPESEKVPPPPSSSGVAKQLSRSDSEPYYTKITGTANCDHVEEEEEGGGGGGEDEMVRSPTPLVPTPPPRSESQPYDVTIIQPSVVWGSQLLSSAFFSSPKGTVHPRGVCCGEEGTLVVTDTHNHCVCILAPTGKCIEMFGREGKGEGFFGEPTAVARDTDGNLLVCDLSSAKLQKFTSKGIFVSKLTSRLFRGNPLGEPWGVAVNHTGTIFVSDWDKSCIHTYNETGRYVGNFGSSSTNASLKYPAGIAVDRRGRLIVADRGNHCICIYMPDGTLLARFGREGHAPGELRFPFGVAVNRNASNIFVSESGNHRISVFDSQGNFLRCFGTRGSERGMFHLPRHLCIDTEDRLIVCDEQNQRIQVFTSY